MAPLESNCLSDVASLNSFITIETIGQQVKEVLSVRGAMRRPHIHRSPSMAYRSVGCYILFAVEENLSKVTRN